MAKEYHECEGCGHVSTIYGSSRREAERKLEWWTRTRPLCHACQFDKEVAAARLKLADLDLPALKGSSSQIESAEISRALHIPAILSGTESETDQVLNFVSPSYYGKAPTLHEALKGKAIEMIERAKDRVCAIDDAAWWVEKKNVTSSGAVLAGVMKMIEDEVLPQNDEKLVAAIDFETTLRPTSPVSELIAIVDYRGKSTFHIVFPEKHDDFNAAVKAFNPQWNRITNSWVFDIPPDSFPDFAAEVSAHILGSGFPIRIANTEIREMTAAGTFKKSEGRRIDYAGRDCFRVDWRRIDGDFYDEVRKIHGSKWDKTNQTVLVPIGSADDLRDFAARFGFPMTDMATKACEAFDEYRRGGMIEGKKREKGKAEPILDRKVFADTITIDPSLLD